MLRGQRTKSLPASFIPRRYAPVQQCGFVTNSKWGFTLGCSPDGLVAADGVIECKSPVPEVQVRMVCEYFKTGKVPDEHRCKFTA
jgi:hypothetical protein